MVQILPVAGSFVIQAYWSAFLFTYYYDCFESTMAYMFTDSLLDCPSPSLDHGFLGFILERDSCFKDNSSALLLKL